MKKLALPFLLLLVAATGCLASKAKQHALWPAVAMAWPEVKSDIGYSMIGRTPPTGVQGAIDKIDGAVRDDDHEKLRGVSWFLLEPLGRAGIAKKVTDGKISSGLSSSRLVQLSEFDKAMKVLNR